MPLRIAALVLAGVPTLAAAQAGFPEFDEARLKTGRGIWMGTCRECHANPLSDAPQVKDGKSWSARVAKGRNALYASALDGFSGAGEMPARGGNPRLSDDDVLAAVDYMIKIAVR